MALSGLVHFKGGTLGSQPTIVLSGLVHFKGGQCHTREPAHYGSIWAGPF